MDKKFKLEEKTSDDGRFYAARCPSLGLTAYGDSPEVAWNKLKLMFSALVDAIKLYRVKNKRKEEIMLLAIVRWEEGKLVVDADSYHHFGTDVPAGKATPQGVYRLKIAKINQIK